MRAFHIEIHRSDLKEYIDWLKSLITICSAAVGALLYKFGADAAMPIKVAATTFGAALVLLCFTFAGFISHKHNSSDYLDSLTKWCLMLGISAFLIGMGALVVQLY